MKTFFEKYGKIFIISFNAIFLPFFLTQIFGFGLFDGILLKFQYLSVTLDNLWLYITIWSLTNTIYLYIYLYNKSDPYINKWKSADEEYNKEADKVKKKILKEKVDELYKERGEFQWKGSTQAKCLLAAIGIVFSVTLLGILIFGEPLSIKKLANERITSKYSTELEYTKKDIELKNADKEHNQKLIESLTTIQEQFKTLGRSDKVQEIQQQIDKLK